MGLLYRKSQLARSLSKLDRITISSSVGAGAGGESPLSTPFSPKTWLLPLDYSAVSRYLSDGKGGEPRCVIVKPVSGKCSFLAMSPIIISPKESCLVQAYIPRPLTLEGGRKFELRLFALLTSFDPMRVLVYKEGLCRLCSAPYAHFHESNIDCSHMHKADSPPPPNSSNNSNSRTLSWLWNYFVQRGFDKEKLWKELCDIVVKTLITVQAPVTQATKCCKINAQNKNPFTCFEAIHYFSCFSSLFYFLLISYCLIAYGL
jgi:hypothetical protein